MSEVIDRMVAAARRHMAETGPDFNSVEEGLAGLARAMLIAAREPTEAMVEAALLAGTNLTVRGPSERLGKRTAGERMADQLRAAIDEALK